MKTKVSPIPQGYSSVTPYLIVDNGKAAIEFYKKVFAATEDMRMEHAGKIGHAELQIGNSKVMLADEHPEIDARSPKAYGGAGISIHLYVDDVDTVFQNALTAGAKQIKPLADMFYGDRCGSVEDPYGHRWHIATHIEDVSDEEIKARLAKMSGKK